MKKLYYLIKYYWHLFKVKELSIVTRDCIDDNIKQKLEKKIDHHEQAVMNYIVKS